MNEWDHLIYKYAPQVANSTEAVSPVYPWLGGNLAYIGSISEDPTPTQFKWVTCAYCGREYQASENECPGCSARVTIDIVAKLREDQKRQSEQIRLQSQMYKESYPAPVRKEPSRFSRLMDLVGWRV